MGKLPHLAFLVFKCRNAFRKLGIIYLHTKKALNIEQTQIIQIHLGWYYFLLQHMPCLQFAGIVGETSEKGGSWGMMTFSPAVGDNFLLGHKQKAISLRQLHFESF